MADFSNRLEKLELKSARHSRPRLSPERRKLLTDCAVLHGDQQASQVLSECRPTNIPSSNEQRAAAIAAGLRVDS
ncbi:hypothetical protein [Nitrobacter hamburgensis]|nr:hypothetical protein [Nitrobacter hamburgensis]